MKEKWIVVLIVLLSLGLSFLPHSGLVFLMLAAGLLMTVLYGRYLAAVFDRERNPLTPVLGWLETFLLRMGGCKESNPMTWQAYCRALLLFNAVAGTVIFIIVTGQKFLPLNPLHLPGMEAFQAFNVVCGFITNTDWQSYSGEAVLSNFSQMAALVFGMGVGTVSGLSVFIAFARGLTGRPIGNFYRDITKAFVYVLLPVLLIIPLFFISQGVPQTLQQQIATHTVEGSIQKIAMGPVASLLTMKLFGTNGGGFFNTNSAHPFENPTAFTNFIEMMLELALPLGLVYLFGLWLKDKKQGWIMWGVMMALLLLLFGIGNHAEQAGNPLLTHSPGIHARHTVNQAASAFQSGGNMEGKEVRFGILPSMLFTTITTSTSTGAVNTMHDSLTPIGGMVPLIDLMLNVVFSGVGVGLMMFLLYGIIAVFLTGLMVGRTPEIFGKKLEQSEIILASVVILLHPLLCLLPTAIAATTPFGLSSLGNGGPHGFTEILYAYTSASADNGSAFGGLNTNTPWYNLSLGLVILIGRYLPIIALLAIADSLRAKPVVAFNPAATLKTNTLLFGCIWLSTIIILGGLTFLPALVLGPVSEHFSLLSGKLY